MAPAKLNPAQRLTLLLTDGGWEWGEDLPRLLEPQGVRALRAASVDQALRVLRECPIHALVVDTALPMEREERNPESDPQSGGLKLLRVIQRLEPSPPALLVRDREFDRRRDNRMLLQALKLDVFSVLDQPVDREVLLDTLRRLLDRYYHGAWPE